MRDSRLPKAELLTGLLLVAATLMAYAPVWNGGFLWDDDIHLTRNRAITAPEGWKTIWLSHDSPQYYPLVWSSFRLEHSLWGFHPAGYHWVNILLHAGSALMVWRILRELKMPGAWLAGAFFALHPVEVSSVAWISERKNVLSLFFYLLALWSWVRFVQEKAGVSGRWYGLALMFYVLALLSKAVACTLTFTLVLVLWLEGRKLDWRRWLQVAPFALLGLGLSVVCIWFERTVGGTAEGSIQLGFLQRVLLASRALWFYAGKLVWPAHLSMVYPRWTIRAGEPQAYAWLLAVIAVGAGLYLARRFLGRGLLAGCLFFAVTLAPALGFVDIGGFEHSFVFDHFQYFASIGLLALGAGGLTRALGAWDQSAPLLRPIVCATVLLVLGTLTWRHAGPYAGDEALWRATIRENPGSWDAFNNLSVDLVRKGQISEATTNLQRALQLQPWSPSSHSNLGLILSRLGRTDEAVAEFRKALETKPSFFNARVGLARVLAELGQLGEAKAHLLKAVAIRPNDAEAHYELSAVYGGLKQRREAVAESQAALKLDPKLAPAHYVLANQLFAGGDAASAAAHYQTALEEKPDYPEAHYQLAVMLVTQGEVERASRHFREAVRLRPDWVEALNNLAWLLATQSDARLRNGPQAVEFAARAVALTHTNDARFVDTLGGALAEAGRFADAVNAAHTAAIIAAAAGPKELEQVIASHLQSYERGQPIREPAAPTATRSPSSR